MKSNIFWGEKRHEAASIHIQEVLFNILCINIGRKRLPNISVCRIHYLFVQSYNQNIKILAIINSDKNLKRKRGEHPWPVPVAVQHVFMCLKARFQHKSS